MVSVVIVRDKASKKTIAEQINEQCTRLNFLVFKVAYDKNYFTIVGEPIIHPYRG